MSLNVAIIGAGWMGETHARAVIKNGDRVALIVDENSTRAQALADQFGAEIANTLQAAQHVDVAIIATPSALHLEQAETLVAMGLHVLVEKPHRYPSQSVAKLKKLVDQSPKIFQVGMTTRFHPGLRSIAEAVHNGTLGDIINYSDRYWFKLDEGTLPDWYFDPTIAGGGVLLTNGVHILDRCRWMLGTDLKVTGVKTARLFDSHKIEDFAGITAIAGPAHSLVHMSLLWTMAEPGPSELAIVGTKGVARCGPDGWSITTEHGAQSGSTPDADTPFELQWKDFAEKCLGRVSHKADDPNLDMLELTIKDIGHIYRLEKDDA